MLGLLQSPPNSSARVHSCPPTPFSSLESPWSSKNCTLYYLTLILVNLLQLPRALKQDCQLKPTSQVYPDHPPLMCQENWLLQPSQTCQAVADSGSLHLLFPVPGMLFPLSLTYLTFTSFRSPPQGPLREACADTPHKVAPLLQPFPITSLYVQSPHLYYSLKPSCLFPYLLPHSWPLPQGKVSS